MGLKMTGPEGRLIVFEGVDGTGKTTLCDDLCDNLRNKQKSFLRYTFPGSSPGTLGELVYRIHHHHSDEFLVPAINPTALQLLHIAAHIDAIETIIKPELSKGAWILLDRYWWSTYVYGKNDEVDERSLELMIQLEKNAWGNILPDVLLLVDTASPMREDEIECESWHRKRQLYNELIEKEKSYYRCAVIETKSGSEYRQKASDKILHEVLS